MRFTFLTTLYSAYIASFYCQRPGLEEKSFAEQKAALDYDGFAWNGAMEPAFRPLGYEVQSIYANVAPLQRAWAREHGVVWPVRWLTEIPLRQVQEFQTELLWVDSLAEFSHRWIGQARSACPSLCRIVGYTGVGVRDADTVKACDAIFASIRYFVDDFRRGGMRSYMIRHAFNPAVLERLAPQAVSLPEMVFAGSIARGEGDHRARERLIEACVDAVPMSIHCPQAGISRLGDIVETSLRRGVFTLLQSLRAVGASEASLEKLPVIGGAADWKKMPLSQVNPRLRSRLKPPFFGLEMFEALRRYTVALNCHIDLARNEAGNIRLFEVTGAGGCLLTDWKPNMEEMFEPDREVAVYRSAEEAVEKARWLLEHRAERDAMAAAGQARVLRMHTFAHRAAEIDAIVRSEFR